MIDRTFLIGSLLLMSSLSANASTLATCDIIANGQTVKTVIIPAYTPPMNPPAMHATTLHETGNLTYQIWESFDGTTEVALSKGERNCGGSILNVDWMRQSLPVSYSDSNGVSITCH